MKSVQIVLVFLFSAWHIFSFASAKTDDERMDIIFSEYVTSIIEYSQNEDAIGAYVKLVQIFKKEGAEHENDLFEEKLRCDFDTYLRYIKENFQHHLEVNITNKRVLGCSEIIGGRTCRFATFTKTIQYNNFKNEVDYLMVVDVSDPEYKIFGLFLKRPSLEDKYFSGCHNIETDEELKRREEFILTHLKTGRKHLSEKKYQLGLNSFEDVLKLDPNNATAKTGLEQCKGLIVIFDRMEYVENLASDRKYNQALKSLDAMIASGLKFKPEWEDKLRKSCEAGIKRLQYENLIAEADYFFGVHRYDEAKQLYEIALKLDSRNASIREKIEKCKVLDPNFGRQELKLAEENARKSKKYYMATFKTYKKYEGTGLLSGGQYDFMCRFLLRRLGKIKREMSYTRNFAKHLIGKYYILAREKNFNNSDLKNLIPERIRHGN